MINIIIAVLKVIFLLGFLVIIHEGGHFLVAKLCKVKVNEFAIGFGPVLWQSKNVEGTKYALRVIPLGGFVSMEGEEERSDKEGSFSKASIPKRIAIVAAGGLVNIIFAVLVYWILSSNMGNFISTKVNNVVPEYGASIAGVEVNDEILYVNKNRIRNKNDLEEVLTNSNGDNVEVVLKRNNNKVNLTVKPTPIDSKDTGIYLGAQGDNVSTKIVAVYPGSSAEKSGIEVNDEILKIDGKDVNQDPYKVVEFIKESSAENVTFTIKRKDEVKEILVKPEIITSYVLGVEFAKAENNFFNNIYYGFWDTMDFCKEIVNNLKMLFTGGVSTNQLTGPIGIASIVSKTSGIADFVYILALISLSLGVTNLLPFPPLDGGKIVIYLIEAIRRKPIKENVEIGIQTAGFGLLIALSIFVAYNDVLRIF